MKRTFIIIACSLLCAVAWAQEEKGAWSIQPKFGLNATTLTSYSFLKGEREEGDTNPRCSPLFAIEAEHQITSKIGVVMGIQYSMQGEREKIRVDGDRITVTDKLDYINVPILVKFYVARNLALKTGLQPSFNIKHDYELDKSTSTSVGSFFLPSEGDLSDIGIDIRAFDLAIPVGVAYEFKRRTRNYLVAEARWNMGLLNVANVESGHPKNFVFQFTLGYKFNL